VEGGTGRVFAGENQCVKERKRGKEEEKRVRTPGRRIFRIMEVYQRARKKERNGNILFIRSSKEGGTGG